MRTWVATAANGCQDKLASCVKTNNCAKKANSRERKRYKAACDTCAAKKKELRATKKIGSKALQSGELVAGGATLRTRS